MADEELNEIKLLRKDVERNSEKIGALEENLKEAVTLMRTCLFGNGNPSVGIYARVVDIEDWIKETKESRVWFNRLVAGAIVAQTIALAFLIIKTLAGL